MTAKQHQWFLTALRRKNSLYCRIDVWGFVSVMLALLFLLMPNNSSYHLPRNPVDLTESHHGSSMPGALKEDAIRIKVARDGQIYFSDLRVSRDKLPDLIQEALTKGAEKKVYILADARARYGKVMEVLSEVRVAEVEKVCFLTE